jgi:transcriptional regulator with XRE-family HTH domain
MTKANEVSPGTFLRTLRESKGMSLFDVSRETGLDPQTIRRCEIIGSITPRSAKRLAKALGCKVEDLKPRDLRGKWNRSER